MIVVTGATGTIGRALIEDLGGAARAVVRRAEQGEELGCDYVVGDLERPESIPLEPGDRLFLNSALWPGFVRAHKAVIDHAAAAGVAQVVMVSVRGVTSGSLLGFGMHGRVDEHLKVSGAPWSTLAPVGFMQNLAGDVDVEEAALHLEKRGMPVQAARDLAELMSQIGDGRWASTTTTVADVLGREPRSLQEFLG